MKKRVLVSFVFLFSIFISLNFVSAGLWEWFFGKEVRMSPDENLAAYYNLDNNLNDLSGNENTIDAGTDSSRYAELVAGKFGQAYEYDGLNDCGIVPRKGNLVNLTKNSFSFEVWAKPKSIPSQGSVWWKSIFATTYSYPDKWYSNGIGINSDGKAVANIVNIVGNVPRDELLSSSNSISLNQWHHFVLSVNKATKTAKLYVDGSVVDSKRYTGELFDFSSTPTPGYYYIGCYDYYNPGSLASSFNGTIDEIKIWSKELSADEVRQNYNQVCVPKNCSSLNKQCGNWSDGCGVSLNCPACVNGASCSSDGECVNKDCTTIGFRIEGKYCSSEYIYEHQKESDEFCENNFECNSNICIEGKCVSGGIWSEFLEWFRKLFQ